MSKVEVLVSTMNQSDFSLYDKMNIQTDAVLANQAGEYYIKEKIINGNSVKLITTPDRGVSRNRNQGLMHASGDILLIADDDVVYVDGYENIIVEAFKKMPKADVLIFDLEHFDNRKRLINKVKKINKYRIARYLSPGIAIRRESWEKANVYFPVLFGSGSKYYKGEETLFLKECLDKKLKIYTYPAVIAKIIQRQSTWFTGYTERFFYDTGATLAVLYPALCKFAAIRIAFKFGGKAENLKFSQILRLLFKGIKDYKKFYRGKIRN